MVAMRNPIPTPRGVDDGVNEVDVLVVGAGPTGLVAAAELVARGVSCRIIDRAPVRSERSRALAVQARSLELLQKMGVADALVARGRRTVGVDPYVEGRRVAELTLGDIGARDTPYPFLLFVSQVETERAIERRLEALGGRVERPVELVSFDQDAGGVTARLARGEGGVETVRTRYLIGADGAHSAVRKGAGLEFRGDAYPQAFALADVELDWDGDPDRLHFFISTRGALVVFPLAGPSSYRLIATGTGSASTRAGDPTLAEFQGLADRLSALPMRLRDPSWLARFRLHHRGVAAYRAGRVFVAGDAAHIHSPAGGQGMNTGIQDAYNLAWKLALVLQKQAPDALLDSYHAERHPVGQRLLRTTDRMFEFAATRNPLLLRLRSVLVPLVVPRALASRARRAAIFRFVSQLDIAYPDSPIVAEESAGASARFRRGPEAGERAPDAPLRAPDGSATTVFDRISGPSHHLLLFGGAAAPSGAGELRHEEVAPLATRWGGLVEPHVIIRGSGHAATPDGAADLDPTGFAHRRYGLEGAGHYLVRPDGHVAFRASGAELAPLERYLQRVFVFQSS